MSWKEWDQGEVVEAGDFQDYIQDQVVQNYADSAARSTALGTAVAEGMVSYLQDSNSVEVYDGSAWSQVGAYVSPNYIINGAFDIWQRGTSFNVTSGGFNYYADRWGIGRFIIGSGYDVSQITDTPNGFEYAKKIQRVSGDTSTSGIYLNHKFETAGRELQGQTVTFSFWARAGADFSGAISGTIRASSESWADVPISSSAEFILSSADNYYSETSISDLSPTTSWQRYKGTVSVPVDSTANAFQLFFLWVPTGTAGANDYFEITGVQLEAGSIATPFKRNANSIQGELAACKRYFERIYPSTNFSWWMQVMCTGADTAIGVVEYTEKRAGPSISVSSATDFAIYTSNGSTRDTISSISFSNARVDRARANFTSQNNVSLSAGDASIISARNVNAVIDIDAEL